MRQKLQNRKDCTESLKFCQYGNSLKISTAIIRMGIIEMTRTGFRKLYFLSYFFATYLTHDFKNNRKTTLMETNQPLLSWSSESAKSQPAPVLNFNSVSRRSWKSILIVEASLKIRYFDFNV